jgi:hypothetical protein
VPPYQSLSLTADGKSQVTAQGNPTSTIYVGDSPAYLSDKIRTHTLLARFELEGTSQRLQKLEDGILLRAFQFFKPVGDVAGLSLVSCDRFEKC